MNWWSWIDMLLAERSHCTVDYYVVFEVEFHVLANIVPLEGSIDCKHTSGVITCIIILSSI